MTSRVPSDPLAEASIVALAGDLIRIPSVNPAIAPDEAHGEQAVAAFACEWLSDRGVRAWLEEAAPGRPNAVAEVIGEPGPTLVFCAHLDTVGTAGKHSLARQNGDHSLLEARGNVGNRYRLTRAFARLEQILGTQPLPTDEALASVA